MCSVVIFGDCDVKCEVHLSITYDLPTLCFLLKQIMISILLKNDCPIPATVEKIVKLSQFY